MGCISVPLMIIILSSMSSNVRKKFACKAKTYQNNLSHSLNIVTQNSSLHRADDAYNSYFTSHFYYICHFVRQVTK